MRRKRLPDTVKFWTQCTASDIFLSVVLPGFENMFLDESELADCFQFNEKKISDWFRTAPKENKKMFIENLTTKGFQELKKIVDC